MTDDKNYLIPIPSWSNEIKITNTTQQNRGFESAIPDIMPVGNIGWYDANSHRDTIIDALYPTTMQQQYLFNQGIQAAGRYLKTLKVKRKKVTSISNQNKITKGKLSEVKQKIDI